MHGWMDSSIYMYIWMHRIVLVTIVVVVVFISLCPSMCLCSSVRPSIVVTLVAVVDLCWMGNEYVLAAAFIHMQNEDGGGGGGSSVGLRDWENLLLLLLLVISFVRRRGVNVIY